MTLVDAPTVSVVGKLPEIVNVLAALFDTPVPPLFAGKVPVTFDAKLTKVVDVVPVPPLAMAKVPATVTAPDVAVLGVKPVEPKSIVVTPSAVLDATFT